MYTQPEQQQSQEKYVVKKEDLESALASGNPEALERFIEEARSAGQQEQTENINLMEQAQATKDPEIIEEAEEIDKETKKITNALNEAIEGPDFVMYLPEKAKEEKGKAEAAARERDTRELEAARKRGGEDLAAYFAKKQEILKPKTKRETPEEKAKKRKAKLEQIGRKFQRPNASI
jgi:hypothetical protein